MQRFSLCICLAFSMLLVGCGGVASSVESRNIEQESETRVTIPMQRKTIVVYFSHTKHTETVAKRIRQETNADIYEIVPEKPYPQDYHPATEVAKREQQENARPDIRGKLPDLSEYDTIILGFPIWWYNTPMIVNTFLESYDFSDKTIAPFCTSGGASIESSVETIRELAKGAKVTEGLTANDPDDITPWLQRQQLLPTDKGN